MSVKRRVYACYDDMKYEGFFKKNLLAYRNEGYFRGKRRERKGLKTVDNLVLLSFLECRMGEACQG